MLSSREDNQKGGAAEPHFLFQERFQETAVHVNWPDACKCADKEIALRSTFLHLPYIYLK